MIPYNENKLNKLSSEVIETMTSVKNNYGLTWLNLKDCINEIISERSECEIKQLADHNQWRKICSGEIGSSYSYNWWTTLKSIIDEIPNRLDIGVRSLTEGIERPSENNAYIRDLHQLGIIGTSNRLSESQFNPIQCMQDTTQILYFMGILGSKWVKDVDVFRDFLIRIQADPNGKVRFLMINPFGKSFKILKSMRGEYLKDESSIVFRSLVDEFPCLEAKYYDFIPCFRLIFIDSKIVAVSRYKLDKNNYIKSNQGWEAPHLVISACECDWSLYDPFLSYYNHIWSDSTNIIDLIK